MLSPRLQLHKEGLECPPKPEKKNFNVNEIIGDVNYDENGDVIPPEDGVDESGEPANPQSY